MKSIAMSRESVPCGCQQPPKETLKASASAISVRVRSTTFCEGLLRRCEVVVSDDDDDAPPPPAPAPPVLCYCERPAALLDGRWVCAQLVEGDFCILGREDE